MGLKIDWEALHQAFQMSTPNSVYFLSRQDGEVHRFGKRNPQLQEFRSQKDRYAMVQAVPSQIQFRWVDTFIASIQDETFREKMRAEVNGKGAFRRFKDLLLAEENERKRWFEYRDEQLRAHMLQWLADQGVVDYDNQPTWLSAQEKPEDSPPSSNLQEFLAAWNQHHGAKLSDDDLLDLREELQKHFE